MRRARLPAGANATATAPVSSAARPPSAPGSRARPRRRRARQGPRRAAGGGGRARAGGRRWRARRRRRPARRGRTSGLSRADPRRPWFDCTSAARDSRRRDARRDRAARGAARARLGRACRDARRRGRAGGERGGVGGVARGAGTVHRQARRRRGGRARGARARGARRRARRAGRGRRDGDRRVDGRGRGALDGLRPRRRADARARRARGGLARLRRPAPLRLRAAPPADLRGGAPRGAARAGARRPHLGGSRGVDRDPPLRARPLPRAPGRARARRPLRHRGRVGAPGAGSIAGKAGDARPEDRDACGVPGRRVPRGARRGVEAGRARVHGADGGGAARPRADRDDGGGHDRRGRRAGGRIPARRLARGGGAARPRGGGALRGAGRVAAVIRVAEEVREALAAGGAVVALETTLVAHGFPPGEGVEVGLESERQVRAAGAVPATIGVLDGQVVIGLTESELARFGPEARKVGPRDLAAAAVQGAVGATTVGGTLAAARAAGIRFMGTGGLGGVHRGFPDPPDVSADLAQLARTPALVVSAGVKSLLDVPATAELLESLGVPALGYRVDTLPLFYAAAGGPPVSARVESPAEAARVAEAHWRLGGGGLLVGRPPDEPLEDVE